MNNWQAILTIHHGLEIHSWVGLGFAIGVQESVKQQRIRCRGRSGHCVQSGKGKPRRHYSGLKWVQHDTVPAAALLPRYLLVVIREDCVYWRLYIAMNAPYIALIYNVHKRSYMHLKL